MPNINSSMIPLVTPGNVFPTIVSDSSLAIRWLTSLDPHFFDVYNRPLADITVRQLIIAKSMDQLGLRLSAQTNFPFLNPATINVGTSSISMPVAWIWDMHVTLKDDWANLRLAVIQRLSGTNDVTDNDFTGTLRLVFTANRVGSSSEVGMFYVDYIIDSDLSWQIRDIKPCTVSEFDNPLPSDQENAIAGYVVFRTLDLEDNSSFFNALAPSVGSTTDSFEVTEYEVSNTSAGGPSVDNDFSFASMSHGSGLLVVSSYNLIPPVGTDTLSVLAALNFPWRQDTNLTSTDKLSTVPSLLFSQFMMTAPMGNRGSTLEENFPVYLSRIRRLDDSANKLQFVFSTNNTIIDSTSDEQIEFASLVIDRGNFGITSGPGTLIEITPLLNLKNNQSASSELFKQNFGSGYVILSSEWATNTAIQDFFDSFKSIVDDPSERYFNAIVSDFALHRSPFNIPTIGQAQALKGSTSRRDQPIYPSDDNLYITESDQGLGEKVDFREVDDIDDNDSISPEAYRGSKLSQSFVLVVDTSNKANFDYDNDILPRIMYLLGRSPIQGDEWFDGTTFKKYDQLSNAWIG